MSTLQHEVAEKVFPPCTARQATSTLGQSNTLYNTKECNEKEMAGISRNVRIPAGCTITCAY